MDADAKKTAMRMIPYGLYVMASETSEGKTAAATVSWVTQASFEPPLITVGVKIDSGIYETAKNAGAFSLNFIGKNQSDIAYNFFKPGKNENGKLNGESYYAGLSGSPILNSAPASIECKLKEVVEIGDHSIFVGEVINAEVKVVPEGRTDSNTLTLRDLGEKIYYGG
jgi:flavin reductase (DIM6/NTAB) family NADH-FMN oxidoreductase RutF